MADNLIERSWAVYEKHQRARGVQTDEVSFVGGFMACYGVLTGRVNIGLGEDATVMRRFEIIQRELEDMRSRVVGAQAEDKRNGG